MAVEISGVTLCPNDDLITGAWLDRPWTGPVDGSAFEVIGWVVSKAPVARLEFVHEQSVVARCELTLARPDVASVYGTSSPVGFWKAIGTAGLAPAFTIEVRVVFQDGRRDVIAEIRGTQQQQNPTFTPCMQLQEPAYQGSGRGRLVQRYLNLLEASLTGMLFEDAPCDYWSDGKFDSNTRLLGRDWPSLSFSMIGSVRMRNLRYACETVILDGVEGDFVETGVWRGGACILMRGTWRHMVMAHDVSSWLTALLDFHRQTPKISPPMRAISTIPVVNSRCRVPMSRIISGVSGYWTNGSFSLRVGSRIRCHTLRSIG